MTKLLYLENSYLKEANASIISVEKKGNSTEITLDQTIFYPQGGGQPSDKGLITAPNGKAHIKHVRMKQDTVIHECTVEGSLQEGDQVSLSINWQLRFHNMRVHSAGHIVHEAIQKLHPELKPIKGEHGDHAFIEYQGNLTEDDRNSIQEEANRIIQNDVRINTEFVSYEELKQRVSFLPEHLPKHKPLRIMSIEGFVAIPDGGTQLARTGEVGGISILSVKDTNNNVKVHYQVNEEPRHAQDPIISELSVSHLTSLLIELEQNARQEVDESKKVKALLRNDLLGSKSEFSRLSKMLASLPKEDRGRAGALLNQVKQSIEEHINEHQESNIKHHENIEITLPGHRPYVGHFHPTTIVIDEMNVIFRSMGFSVYDGPEIESDEFNYDRVNLPQDHPARDLQDTLYIKEPDVILRTHTSSVEAHILQDFTPPYRFVIPGKVYRYENVNASNNVMFYQYQGLAVGEGITMAHLKGTLDIFVKKFFGEERETRFRCKYYPEVEPGVGVDISCAFCNKKGCVVCKWRGWIEMLGAGMIHPNMFRRVGLNPSTITGFAWGMGLDRIVMQRFGINDIRALYNGEIGYKE